MCFGDVDADARNLEGGRVYFVMSCGFVLVCFFGFRTCSCQFEYSIDLSLLLTRRARSSLGVRHRGLVLVIQVVLGFVIELNVLPQARDVEIRLALVLRAQITLKGSSFALSCLGSVSPYRILVNMRVLLQVAPRSELLVANFTFVRFFAGVNSLVPV